MLKLQDTGHPPPPSPRLLAPSRPHSAGPPASTHRAPMLVITDGRHRRTLRSTRNHPRTAVHRVQEYGGAGSRTLLVSQGKLAGLAHARPRTRQGLLVSTPRSVFTDRLPCFLANGGSGLSGHATGRVLDPAWAAGLWWSPPPESNRRPHPYHGSGAHRRANRRLRRSQRTVDAAVMGSVLAPTCPAPRSPSVVPPVPDAGAPR